MMPLQPGCGAEPADRLGQAAGFLQQGGQIIDGRRQIRAKRQSAPETSLGFGHRVLIAQDGAEIAPAFRCLRRHAYCAAKQASADEQQAEMIEHLRLSRQQDQEAAIEAGGFVLSAGAMGGDGGGEEGLRGGIGHS